MRLYYFVSGATEKIQRIHHFIYDILMEEGVDVFSNVDFFHTGYLPEKDAIRMKETGEFFLGKMNGVIIEGSQFSTELGYILALILSQKRPLLYFHPKGLPMHEMLERVLKQNSHQPFVFLEYYHRQDEMLKKIQIFLRHLEVPTRKEKSNIKFTLRISPTLDRYLNWKSKQYRLSKANFLRKKVLEPMREEDTEYQTKSF